MQERDGSLRKERYKPVLIAALQNMQNENLSAGGFWDNVREVIDYRRTVKKLRKQSKQRRKEKQKKAKELEKEAQKLKKSAIGTRRRINA